MDSTLAILGGEAIRTRPFPDWPVFDLREIGSFARCARSENRDLDDIVAAALKIASGAVELNQAKLSSNS